GGKFPVSSLGQLEVRAYREAKRQEFWMNIFEFLQAGKLYIDMDSIEKGVVELVSQYRIGKLVMGGATDGRYSREGIKELAANDVQNVRSNSSRSQLVTLVEENPSNRDGYQGQVLYPRTRVLDSVADKYFCSRVIT
ncbi:hypothetical protein Ancab_025780, partial [Ancistrocladus abbreviatus]